MAFTDDSGFDLDDDDFLLVAQDISESCHPHVRPSSGNDSIKRRSFEFASDLTTKLATKKTSCNNNVQSISEKLLPSVSTQATTANGDRVNTTCASGSFVNRSVSKTEARSLHTGEACSQSEVNDSSCVCFASVATAYKTNTATACKTMPVTVNNLFTLDDTDFDLSLGSDSSDMFPSDIHLAATSTSDAIKRSACITNSAVTLSGCSSSASHVSSSTSQSLSTVTRASSSVSSNHTADPSHSISLSHTPVPLRTSPRSTSSHTITSEVKHRTPGLKTSPDLPNNSYRNEKLEARQRIESESQDTASFIRTTGAERRSRKRKFPGPAGALPKLKQGMDVSELSMLQTSSPRPSLPDTQSSQEVCSQSNEDVFRGPAWCRMKRELEPQASLLLSEWTLSNILKKAQRRLLDGGRVPVLCALIDSVSVFSTDISATFKDPSGVMQGTLHRQLIKEYQTDFTPGTVLVLRQVGIFSPSGRSHYLNITPNNLVRFYTTDSSNSVNQHTVSSFQKEDFIKSTITTYHHPGATKQPAAPVGQQATTNRMRFSGAANQISTPLTRMPGMPNQGSRPLTRISGAVNQQCSPLTRMPGVANQVSTPVMRCTGVTTPQPTPTMVKRPCSILQNVTPQTLNCRTRAEPPTSTAHTPKPVSIIRPVQHPRAKTQQSQKSLSANQETERMPTRGVPTANHTMSNKFNFKGKQNPPDVQQQTAMQQPASSSPADEDRWDEDNLDDVLLGMDGLP